MSQKVPIPTDNIYKFYALFGLALLFVCVIGFVSIYNASLDRSLEIYQEFEILKKIENPSDSQSIRIEVLDKLNEIIPANKDFYMTVINGAAGFCITLICFGFWQWQFKVQPLQDELLAKQLEKTELEIKALHNKINYTSFRRRTH